LVWPSGRWADKLILRRGKSKSEKNDEAQMTNDELSPNA
jgi:hypothetical protein